MEEVRKAYSTFIWKI